MIASFSGKSITAFSVFGVWQEAKRLVKRNNGIYLIFVSKDESAILLLV